MKTLREGDHGPSVIKALHEEFLVTKQMATGSGEAWIPQGADFRGVPKKFKDEDLGLSFDHGPSIFVNSRGLASKNEKRRHQAHVGEYEKLAHEAKALGVKPKPMQPESIGCGGCESCAPSSRKAHVPRRARNEAPRWWLPGTKGTKRRGSKMGQRDRHPMTAATRQRILRERLKEAGMTVKLGQIVREGTDQ